MTRAKIPVEDRTATREPAIPPWDIEMLHDFSAVLHDFGLDDSLIMAGSLSVGDAELFSGPMVHGTMVKQYIESAPVASQARVVSQVLHQSTAALQATELRVLRNEVDGVKSRLAALEQAVACGAETQGQNVTLARCISKLAQAFELPDAGALVQHLAAHPAMSAVLVEAAVALRKYFDSDARLQLRDDEGLLTLAIGTKLEVPGAELLLSKFLDEWWLKNEMVEDSVVVTLDWI